MNELGKKPALDESFKTALAELTPEDRDRLAMDAWEPSLLGRLLEALDETPGQMKRRSNGPD